METTKTIRDGFVMKTMYGFLTKSDFIKKCKWEITISSLLDYALKNTISILADMDGKVINKSIATKVQKILDDKGIEVKVEYTNEYGKQLRFIPKNKYSEERNNDGTSIYSDQVAGVKLQWYGNSRLDALNSTGEWNKAMEWRNKVIRAHNDAAVNYDKYILMSVAISDTIDNYMGECNLLLRMNITRDFHYRDCDLYEKEK